MNSYFTNFFLIAFLLPKLYKQITNQPASFLIEKHYVITSKPKFFSSVSLAWWASSGEFNEPSRQKSLL